jgi:hypothetical protein
MEHGTKLMALIFEHFGKGSPEQWQRATRFADAVALAERERCAKLLEDVQPASFAPDLRKAFAAAIRKGE